MFAPNKSTDLKIQVMHGSLMFTVAITCQLSG